MFLNETAQIDRGDRQKKGRRLRRALWLIPLIPATACPAFAQERAPAPQAAPAAGDEAGVADIVVTAQKRSERLADVPMSVSALSGSRLTDLGGADVRTLVKAVPGLNYIESGYGTPVYNIRGIGFYDNSMAATPAVTVYVDQIPLAYPQETRNAAFDLERVEVLKGPQGTLFGQNSTGGAINYIAAKPTNDFHAGIDASYGRFNTVDATGYLSGPLSDGIKARLAVHTRQSGDWQYSYTRKDKRGQTDILQGRLLVDVDPSDALHLEFGATGWRDHSDTQAAQLLAVTPNVPARVDPRLPGYALPPRNARAADWSPGIKNQRHDNFYQFSLRGDYEFTPDVTLTSLTSYARLKVNSLLDGDGTNLVIFEPLQTGHIKSFNQELRLAANPTEKLKLVIGGNYQHDNIYDNYDNSLQDGSTARQFLPAIVPATWWFADTKVKTASVFGNADYAITSQLTIQGGIRYTDARRQFKGCFYDGDGSSLRGIFQGLANSLRAAAGLPAVTFAPGACLTLDPVTFNSTLVNSPLNENNVSWRASLNWKPDADTLLYANVSRGYKAGTYGSIGATNASQYIPATQESVLAYEVGSKLSFADRRVQLSGAVFYYDYSDKQLRGKFLTPLFGPLERLINVPKSRVIGAEAELILRPTKGLRLTGGATYVDSKVRGSYFNYAPYGALADFGGQDFPFTPHWQVNGDIQYDFPLSDRLNGFVGSNVYHQSSSTGAFSGGANFVLKAYTTLDVRAGVSGPGDRWRVSAFGRNITNTLYYTTVAFVPPDTTVRFTGQPVTYGIQASFKY